MHPLVLNITNCLLCYYQCFFDDFSTILRWGHEALKTEKDRARASADVQSSQKTLAQRLPHFSALPQGNALRSIFLRPRASCILPRLCANYI